LNTLQFEVREKLELSQADHDVAIKGWDQAAIELVVDGNMDQCVVEQRDEALHVEARAPLAIHVPRGTMVSAGQVSGDLLLHDLDRAAEIGTVHGDASVHSGQAAVSFQEVHGDLAVEGVNGPLSVGQTHGDVHLSHIGAASLARVHGDVNARAVAGDLGMGAVSGDVRARDIAGALTIEEGLGDFRGQDLPGGMNVHAVKGDLSLKTALTPGLDYRAQANGDVRARFPEGTSARLELAARGNMSVKGFQIEEQSPDRIVALAGSGEGEGEARVTLSASGDLSVKVRSERENAPQGLEIMDGLAEQIEAQVAESLGEIDVDKVVAREIEKAMRQAEREMEKAQRKAEKASRRAERHARSAEERAQRAQERAQRKAQKFQAKFERRWGPPSDAGPGKRGPRSSRAAHKGPSQEDQIAVLKMLQENKISVDEAETLLKAMGA
jgi:hypothetical protein